MLRTTTSTPATTTTIIPDCSLLLARVPCNVYTHTLDTRPLRLRTYPLLGGFFLFAGAGGLRQAGKHERAGNSSEDGARISLPTIGISAGPARRGRGRTRESGRKGGGGTRLKGNMPGERGRGGGTIGDRKTDQGGRRRLERGGRRIWIARSMKPLACRHMAGTTLALRERAGA